MVEMTDSVLPNILEYFEQLSSTQDGSIPYCVVFAGANATGKSSLALKTAQTLTDLPQMKKLGLKSPAIVNMDSRQVYKHMLIGTGSPLAFTGRKQCKDCKLEGITHYLYNFTDPGADYSAFTHKDAVYELIRTLTSQHRPIFLVGGTGLYIDAVLHDYKIVQTRPDEGIRSRVKQWQGGDETTDLKTALLRADLATLQKLADDKLKTLNSSDRQNPHRLRRLIEKSITGESAGRSKTPIPHLFFELHVPKSILLDKITRRVQKMMENDALLEENLSLLNMGYDYSMPAMRSIGYQEFAPYFSGSVGLQEVTQNIIRHSVQYAKRQRTWFKKVEDKVVIEKPRQPG